LLQLKLQHFQLANFEQRVYEPFSFYFAMSDRKHT